MGQCELVSFEGRVIPRRGLDSLVLEDSLKKQLTEIVHTFKARAQLCAWGLSQHNGFKQQVMPSPSPSGTSITSISISR